MLGGATGLAEYFDVDVPLLRLDWNDTTVTKRSRPAEYHIIM